MAAVELLIGHAVWLRRNDFIDRFVTVETDLTLVGETVPAWVDWHAAVEAVEAGALPCSGSEGQVLRIAAGIAEGIPVDLGEALSSLDDRNLVLVAEAVLRTGGATATVGVRARGESQ